MSKKKNRNRRRRTSKRKINSEPRLTKEEYEAALAREKAYMQQLEYLESVGVPIDWDTCEPLGI